VTAPLGVGLIGAGPVVQAIHLPTLARLRDTFTVRNVMDVSPEIAASVAGRVDASWSTTVEDLLTDDAVDVVAVCSPSPFHADQVIAAMRAGKRAVLCEKPFAETRDQATAIADVSLETGVPVLVGAMHTFDPGWTAVASAWGGLTETAHTVRSRIVIPPNARFEDWATQVLARPDWPTPDISDPSVRAGLVHGAIMGLAIHDLPLVRRFVPQSVRVDVADVAAPFGYIVGLQSEGRMVQLMGAVTSQWEPSWTFEAFDDSTRLHVEFTPSYVHAGSARAKLTRNGATTVFGPYDHNGYEGEWRALAQLAQGSGAQAPPLATLIDDLTFALDIADQAAGLITGGAR